MIESQEKLSKNLLQCDDETVSIPLTVEEKLRVFANLIVDRLLEEQSQLESSG